MSTAERIFGRYPDPQVFKSIYRIGGQKDTFSDLFELG